MKVSDETKKKLKEWKKRLGVRSIDELLGCMDIGEVVQEAPVSASADEDEDAAGAQKRRKIYTEDALYSIDLVAKRKGMMKCLTGFDEETTELLIRRFSEVSLGLVFFSSFTLGHGAGSAFASRSILFSRTSRSSRPTLPLDARATAATVGSLCAIEC